MTIDKMLRDDFKIDARIVAYIKRNAADIDDLIIYLQWARDELTLDEIKQRDTSGV